jgi:hypothetical protein
MCWQHEESMILVVEDMWECLDHDPSPLKPSEA